MKEEIHGQGRDVEGLRQQLRQVNATNEKLRKTVSAAQTQASRYEAELEEVQQQLSTTQAAFTAKEKQLGDRDRQVTWHKNRLGTLEGELAEARAEQAGTAKKLQQAREEGDHIRADYKRLVTQLQTSEEDNRQATQRLKESSSAAETSLKQEQGTLAACRAELESKVNELDQANQRIASLERDLKNRRADLADVTRQRSDLQDLVDGIDDIRANLAHEMESRKALERENAMVVAASESLSVALEQAREEADGLRRGAATADAARVSLEAQVDELQQRLTSSTSASAEGIHDLQEQLAARAGEILRGAAALKDRDAELARVQEQLAGATERAETLAAQVEAAREEAAATEAQANGLQQELMDAEEAARLQKRKQAHAVKDLSRQLEKANRKLEAAQAAPPALEDAGSPSTPRRLSYGSHAASPTPSVHGGGGSATPGHRSSEAGGAGSSANSSTSSVGGGGHLGGRGRPPSSAGAGAGNVAVSGSPASPSGSSPSGLQRENRTLVARLCQMRQAAEKAEEKMAFYEEHVRDLTNDLNEKTHIIRQYLMREQRGMFPKEEPSVPGPASPKKRGGGGLKGLFGVGGKTASGEAGGADEQLSTEVVRKLQAVLEDTLTKNMQLQSSVDHLSRQVEQQHRQEDGTNRALGVGQKDDS